MFRLSSLQRLFSCSTALFYGAFGRLSRAGKRVYKKFAKKMKFVVDKSDFGCYTKPCSGTEDLMQTTATG